MEVWTQVAVPLLVALLTSTALWGVVSKVILKRMELTAKRSKADDAEREDAGGACPRPHHPPRHGVH